MATLKAHIYSGEDDGTVSCDYRGQGELHGEHKTVWEHEFGPDATDNPEIENMIKVGPTINKALKDNGVTILGMGLRFGVFDH